MKDNNIMIGRAIILDTQPLDDSENLHYRDDEDLNYMPNYGSGGSVPTVMVVPPPPPTLTPGFDFGSHLDILIPYGNGNGNINIDVVPVPHILDDLTPIVPTVPTVPVVPVVPIVPVVPVVPVVPIVPTVPTETVKPTFDATIKGQPIYIQCTWANCYTEPVKDKGLCIRSYDRKVLVANKSTDSVIGYTTGNYFVDKNNVVWLEAELKYCNRRGLGWFRQIDIWHAKKNTDQNPLDKKAVVKSNVSWLAWLTIGTTVVRMITG